MKERIWLVLSRAIVRRVWRLCVSWRSNEMGHSRQSTETEGQVRNTRGLMRGRRADSTRYITGSNLPLHNNGARGHGGVGFETSPGQAWHCPLSGWSIGNSTPLHIPPTGRGTRDIMNVTRPTLILGTCLWRRDGSKRRRREAGARGVLSSENSWKQT